jgi:toluene monooxygenase system ferredoxin subunit
VSFVRVASLEDLWEGEMLACTIDEARVVVLRGEDYVAAYEDRCVHLGIRLSEGLLRSNVLTCRAHLWQYDARTGRGINPRAACLRAFATRVEDGAVFVDVAGGGES